MEDDFPPDVTAAKYRTKGSGSIAQVVQQVRRKGGGPWSPYEDEKWIKKRKLGAGGQGEVFLQECTSGQETGRFRAVKLVPYSDKSGRRRFIQELQTMIRFSTAEYEFRFVQMKGWYEIEERICIAMEYLPKGNLSYHLVLKSMSELDCQQIISQVVEGLNLMHQAGLAHRDIKPQNILVQDLPTDNSLKAWWVKLADFGIAHKTNVPTSDVGVGTEEYKAPELQRLTETSTAVDFAAADMFAVGVMTFYLHTKKRGFGGLAAGFEDARSLAVAYPQISVTAAEFILDHTNENPRLRCSSEGSLAHTWIRDLPTRAVHVNRTPSLMAAASIHHSIAPGAHAPTRNATSMGLPGHNLTIPELTNGGNRTDYLSLIPSSSLPNTTTLVEPEHFHTTPSHRSTASSLDQPLFTSMEHANGGRRVAWLHEAIQTGDVTRVDDLLSRGHAREFTSHAHFRHLNLALQLRFPDIVRSLVRHGAPISIRELCTAVTSGDPTMVELIAPYVASLSTIDEAGTTAFHQAALGGDPGIIRVLVALGADMTCLDRNGEPPLFGPVSRGNYDTVRLLLTLGASLDVLSSNGSTVLHVAALNGQHEMLKRLIPPGAHLKATTHAGDTVLHCATEVCNLPMIQLLFIEGLDPRCRNENGVTPIYLSLKRDHLDAIKFYIQEGIAIDSAMKSPELKDTALATAIEDGQLELVKLVRAEGQVNPSIEPFVQCLAAASGYRLLVNYFLDEGYDFSLIGPSGDAPLHAAARRDCAVVFEHLLQIGLDPDSENSKGETAFDLACQEESLDVLKQLIASKKVVTKKDGPNRWPLTFLHEKGQELPLSVVELLINTQTYNLLAHVVPKFVGSWQFSTYAYVELSHVVFQGLDVTTHKCLFNSSGSKALYAFTKEHSFLRSWTPRKEWVLRELGKPNSPEIICGSLLSGQSGDGGYLDSFIRVAPFPDQAGFTFYRNRGSNIIIRAMASEDEDRINFRFAKKRPLRPGADRTYEEPDEWEWRQVAGMRWELFRLFHDAASWGPRTDPLHNKNTYAFPTLEPNRMGNPEPIAALSLEEDQFDLRPLKQRLTNNECILTLGTAIMIWVLISTKSLDEGQCRLWTTSEREDVAAGKYS